MNNRQKRLCRALLDFYDASGAQPYPLAQLAKKTGYDASDIYDKDSQSGDLWPFDPKARGNYTGMLSFTWGKNPTVSITTAGLVALEKLCGDGTAAVREEKKSSDIPKPPPARDEKPAEAPKPVPPTRSVSTPPRPVPARSKSPFSAPKAAPLSTPASGLFSSDDIDDARFQFKYWLKTNPAGKALLAEFQADELVEAAFDKFFSEFLKSK